MKVTTNLIQSTIQQLINQEPEQHAQIRQNLYDHLALSFDKQLALYSNVLGPASSGKIETHNISNAVNTAIKLLDKSTS
ncbi:PAS factor family protein [Vibrio ziniensis]|uniref:Secretion protein n=1 Tax=Vibrio ziniensis TaxID=2711221 RepID=A0A6G7CIH2_9VIBR|nr:PAS factor family protein [Vibrio ziniensis]QIH41899.1 secretion protein [Vibrio ziniensis]